MRVGVIGGGLAGLAAACELVDRGHAVTLLERRPWAGGKTYSFVDRESGEPVDNGQHIAMRCTTAYVAFLEKLGAAHLLRWQKRLRVPVYDERGRRSELRADALPFGLHLAPSFVAYKHLSLADKLRVARAILSIHRGRPQESVADVTFGEWLRAHGQSESAIRGFWDLIVVPALNCRCDDGSAAQALFVFREGFLKSPESAAVGVPTVGLSALHVEPALRYIEAHGGDVRLGAAVEHFEVRSDADGARAEAIVLTSGERLEFDAYVAALPPRQLLDALPPDIATVPPFNALRDIRTSPIVNLHLWFDGPIADFEFAAFTDCDLQWVFRPASSQPSSSPDAVPPLRQAERGPRGEATEHVVVSLSAADRYMPMDKRQLIDLLLPQLRRALPLAKQRTLVRSALIKEPDATFMPSPGLQRPGPETTVPNLFLGGAYTDTGWPATMESAVRSGIEAARAVERSTPTIERRLATALA